MRPAPPDPPELERYLRLATRGLLGRDRAVVRDELRTNALEAAREHRTAGFSEGQALALALRGLGKPGVISAGMVRVYVMPNLVRSGLLFAVLSSLGVVLFSSSTAQVSISLTNPIPSCAGQVAPLYVSSPCLGGPWLSLRDLRATLEPMGVKITGPDEPRDETSIRPDLLTFAFPGGRPVRVAYREQAQDLRAPTGPKSLGRASADYLNLNTFLREVSAYVRLPVVVEGWDKPRLSIGQTSFALNASDTRLNGLLAWGRPLDQALAQLSSSPGILGPTVVTTPASAELSQYKPPHRHRLRLERPNAVYALLTREDPVFLGSADPGGSAGTHPEQRLIYLAYLAPADTLGGLELGANVRQLEFVREVQALGPAKANTPLKALLIRLTGRLDPAGDAHEIAVPSPTTSEAVR